MARRARIGIIRARHDDSVNYIPDPVCLEMFFHNPRNTAVFDYWANVTRGWLDFRNSELMPWVDISLSSTDLGQREAQGQKAYAALQAKVGELPSGFDGVDRAHPPRHHGRAQPSSRAARPARHGPAGHRWWRGLQPGWGPGVLAAGDGR